MLSIVNAARVRLTLKAYRRFLPAFSHFGALSVVGFKILQFLQPYQIRRFYPKGTPLSGGVSLTLSNLFSAEGILC